MPGANPVDIAELKSKSVSELHEMAEELNISNYSGLRKQDLIFRIEQNLLDSEVVLRGRCSKSRTSTATTPTKPSTGSDSTTCALATPKGASGWRTSRVTSPCGSST
jgi:transcription termination factor Rho